LSEQEESRKTAWRFRIPPAMLGAFWLFMGIVVATRAGSTKMLSWSYFFVWMILFGFPCFILFRLSFYRANVSGKPSIKPTKPVSENRKTEKFLEFVDRHGRKLYGTYSEVEEWRKIDEAQQNDFLEWHPRDFEKFIADLFRRMGYQADLTPYSRDYGADIVLEKDNRRLIVQIKKYSPDHLVEYEEVKNTLGALPHFRADKAIFLATSDFTDEARALEKSCLIELWNRNMLEELIDKYFLREKSETKEFAKDLDAKTEEENEVDIYKQAFPELSEEEAELQETQEVDMDFEDEDDDK
jgi:restriction system protein